MCPLNSAICELRCAAGATSTVRVGEPLTTTPTSSSFLLLDNRSDFLLLPGDLVCEEVLRDLAEVSELWRCGKSLARPV